MDKCETEFSFGGGLVGILGGTFDPVHQGHLAVAARVKDYFSLDSVIFVPAWMPPHKQEAPVSSFAHRLAMLKLAVAACPGFKVSSLEAERSGPSYTIDTLVELKNRLADQARIYFIIGIDAFVEIPSWKQYQRLPDLANFVVIEREGLKLGDDPGSVVANFSGYSFDRESKAWVALDRKGRIYPLAMEPVNVSSTMVRQRIGEGKSIFGLVPGDIEDYIARHGLYGGFASLIS
ncbi:MAG: nicotinate-nucleotide adenylyltransferase [Proteobacteria bacterium]|nr:nicotinate-nucleotide adenylyltransferase [Pseudomonadota bacterium]